MKKGFTLIEVLLVTMLLAFLAMATFAAVRSTLQTKERVDIKTEMLQGGRAALGILDRDFRLAFFSYSEDLGWNPKPPQTAVSDNYVPPTMPTSLGYFKGNDNSVLFSARSHQRLSANSPESQEHYVSYKLDGDKLIRGESVRHISREDREEREFRTFTVVNKVNKFSLQYWDNTKDDWVSDWDTENAAYLKRLPMAVKFELEYMPEVEDDTTVKVEPMKISSVVTITQSALKTNMLQPDNVAPSPGTGEATTETKR